VDAPVAGIVRAVRLALADHVEVALEDRRRRALAPGRRRHVDDEVAGVVATGREPARGSPGEHVRDDLLLLVRRARDPGEGREVAPEAGGLEPGERVPRHD
jgi:hypothetical protein